MAKSCIFCGRPAIRKTKEHVVPRWLLRIAGEREDDVRIWTPLGRDTPDVRQFAQRAFHFPACGKCNQTGGDLESAVKPVVEALLEEQPLSARELEVLLDWLDKVRIGIWLGMRYLEKDPFGIAPTFHITDRIGAKDRALLVYKVNANEKGWGTLGTSTPAFHIQPSCFTFFLNSWYLLSVSSDFLLSREFGFPYATAVSISNDAPVEFRMMSGTRRFAPPLLRFPHAPECGEVCQAVLGVYLQMPLPDADAAYVRSFSRHGTHGAGAVFVARGDDQPEQVTRPTLAWRPSLIYPPSAHTNVFLRQTLSIQNLLLDLYRTAGGRVESDVEHSQRFNESQIAEIERRMAPS